MIRQTNAPGTGGEGGNPALTSITAFNASTMGSSATEISSDGAIQAVINAKNALLNERTGIILASGVPSCTDGTPTGLTGDKTTRTLSVGTSGKSFNFFNKGELRLIEGIDTVEWTDVTGLHYFYYADGGTILTHTTTFSDTFIFGPDVFVAYLYWDATSGEMLPHGVPFMEMHGAQMDGADHYHWHNGIGAVWYSGMALGNFNIDVGGTPADATAAQFSLGSGSFADEDLIFSPSTIGATTAIPILYLSGTEASPVLNAYTTANFKHVIGSDIGEANKRIYFNEISGGNWILSDPGNSDYVLMHYFAIGTADSAK